MKYMLFTILTLLTSTSFATESLSVKELQSRFELRTDIYVVSDDGKKVISGPAYSSVSRMLSDIGKMTGGSSNSFAGNNTYIQYSWEILNDGTSKFVIEEYESGGKKFTGLIERKEFLPVNFEPIVWKSKRKNPANVVMRFIPVLRETSKPVSLESLPLSGKNASITDSDGYLWGDEIDFNGKYTGFKTHRGSIILSYVPFKGSTEMGIAEGKKITLAPVKNFKIKIISATELLPTGVSAKVYGMYDPKQKSAGLHSVHGWDSPTEDRILKGFRN